MTYGITRHQVTGGFDSHALPPIHLQAMAPVGVSNPVQFRRYGSIEVARQEPISIREDPGLQRADVPLLGVVRSPRSALEPVDRGPVRHHPEKKPPRGPQEDHQGAVVTGERALRFRRQEIAAEAAGGSRLHRERRTSPGPILENRRRTSAPTAHGGSTCGIRYPGVVPL